MEKIKIQKVEILARAKYVSFIQLLRILDLYEESYDYENIYWDFVEVLNGQHNR